LTKLFYLLVAARDGFTPFVVLALNKTTGFTHLSKNAHFAPTPFLKRYVNGRE
jgi:hypothetical protein